MRGRRKKPQRQGAAGAAGKGVRIHRERKGRGGKVVCIITGLTIGDDARKTLLKQLKSRLGTGGTIKGDTIEIQGDHRDTLIELLAAQGIKAKPGGG